MKHVCRQARKRALLIGCMLLAIAGACAPARARILIPMDLTQSDHLRAYGMAYAALDRGENVEWLLNYRGGSFLLEDTREGRRALVLAGVRGEETGASDEAIIYQEIDTQNMEVVLLEKAPRIAVYAPPFGDEPWDDAVVLALDYAEIPYDLIYDVEVQSGRLAHYDWLHLHHEDFSGQHGKFYAGFRHADWYKKRQGRLEQAAQQAGFARVWQHKHATAARIKEYVARGGFLFAMCSGTDTFDIARAAGDGDIVDTVDDGTPVNPRAQTLLDFSRHLAFENLHPEMHPYVYEFSNIDMSDYSRLRGAAADFFVLFEFSAKEDPVPTMLTQCHVNMINGFMGQTTSYNRETLKKSSLVLGEVPGTQEIKYIHGNFGKGSWVFYGGHDPEDYEHRPGDPPTRPEPHKNSPSYRLNLNNLLSPAAQKKERKT